MINQTNYTVHGSNYISSFIYAAFDYSLEHGPSDLKLRKAEENSSLTWNSYSESRVSHMARVETPPHTNSLNIILRSDVPVPS